MNRFSCHLSRARFLNLYLVMAVAAELLSALTAHARMIEVSAMSRDGGVWTTAKAPVLPIEELSSRGDFMAAMPPSVLVSESQAYAFVPDGYYFYSPLSYDPLSLNPIDSASDGVRCPVYFDGVWMGADASPNAREAGLRSDSNDAPPLLAQSPPVAKSSPGAVASDRGDPAKDDAGGPANAETFDEPAPPVFCPSARQRTAPGLVLANLTGRRDAARLCRREIDGEGERRDRLASARLCEWRCETDSDERLLAGSCPLSRPGNELEFALFEFQPRRAEATVRRRAPRGMSRAATLGATPRPCRRRCHKQVDAALSAGFRPRRLQANALHWTPPRVDARRAATMTWMAFSGNSEMAAPGETPRLCVRSREAPVVAAPSAGFCERAPRDNGPEPLRATFDRRARALTCGLQKDGEGAAAVRERPRPCEWRREPRAPAAEPAEFCPNPRLLAAVQRDPLDFSPVPASVTAARICRRVACAILVFDTGDLRPASLSAMGDGSEFPAPTPGESGVVDLGLARSMRAARNVNGPGVWLSVVTETQKSYCPMGTTPLHYARMYFQYASTPPVPEPSTWALMLLAFLGVGGVGWRGRWRGGEMG